MARVFGCKSFSFKNVPQVGAARGASDFRALAVRVQAALYRTWDFLIEAGPTATGMEFCFRSVKRSAATPANIGSGFEKVIIFTAERRFGTFAFNYVSFFRSQYVPGHLGSFLDCSIRRKERCKYYRFINQGQA
jgi:hypothetical protein